MDKLDLNNRLEILFTFSSGKSISLLNSKIQYMEPNLFIDFLEKSILYHGFSKKFSDFMVLQNKEIICVDFLSYPNKTKLMINYDKSSNNWFIKEQIRVGKNDFLSDTYTNNSPFMNLTDVIKFMTNYNPRNFSKEVEWMFMYSESYKHN